jgi:hypothetical protein
MTGGEDTLGWLDDVENALGLGSGESDYQAYAANNMAGHQPTDDDLAQFTAKTGVSESTATSWFSNLHCCCCCCP